jgi:cysteine-rich repeat protein
VTNVAAGEACDDGNKIGGDGCSTSCAFERANSGGDTCANAIALSLGTNQVTFSASAKNYLVYRPTCVQGEPSGPDVVLSYTATFTGTLEVTLAKADSRPWVGLVNQGVCGDTSAAIGCMARLPTTSMVERVPVVNGRTYYFYVSKTGTDVTPLSNPFSVTLTRLAAETGETCSTTAKRITLGTNTVRWLGTTNDHLTATPSCAAGHAVRGPDVVFEYDAPTSGTLSVSINKPAATRWVAVIGDYACGNVAPPLACMSDLSNTSMKGKLQVTAGYKYLLYLAATDEGTISLQVPLTITLSQ